MPESTRQRTNPLLLLLAILVPVGVVWATLYFTQNNANQELIENNEKKIFEIVGLAAPVENRLDSRFIDDNQDLVADAPKDVKDQIDPDTLVFSYVPTPEPEKYRDAFKEFCAHLGTVTGKKIEYAMFTSSEAQLRAFYEGKLHVAGINTGIVPRAVDACGFVPICKLGGADGVATYKMLIIVPADSAIKTVDDLKGHELVLTEPNSNSGFKAPLVELHSKHALKPGRDFQIRYSRDHSRSAEGVATHEYEAAAVASDVLQRDVKLGKLKESDYRVIFTSESFPTAALGYAYNLKPELAAKVKEAMLSFNWSGSGLETAFGKSDQAKFVAANFKDDWANVRKIDDLIGSPHKVPEELVPDAPMPSLLNDVPTSQPTTPPKM